MEIWNESDYYLAFNYCEGIGPIRLQLIKKVFDSLQSAWQADSKTWQSYNFQPSLIKAVTTYQQTFDLDKTKKELSRLQISYISQNDENYPYLLSQIPNPPIGLFIKGSLQPQDNKALAVVGTRKVTPYGREVTQKLVSNLVSFGFTIVSGLARGVDGIAHRSCLEHGGRTIAVLGSGLDSIYPPEHRGLAEEIIRNGALVSEYPPQTKPVPGNFPARNRIVSGLSLGILVTEGSVKSGTKITASLALEQNREVFAVPGPITNPMSEGPGELIQMGAKLVMNARDILAELRIDAGNNAVQTSPASPNGNNEPTFENSAQQKIWQYLLSGTQHIDDICRSTQIPITQITTALTLLELRGLVKSLGDGNYMAM